MQVHVEAGGGLVLRPRSTGNLRGWLGRAVLMLAALAPWSAATVAPTILAPTAVVAQEPGAETSADGAEAGKDGKSYLVFLAEALGLKYIIVFMVLSFALVALLVVESRSSMAARPRWFLEALFECISALGTVGLSTGITPALTDPGKIVLVALMLVGRLGPITAAVALSRERRPYQPEYPQEEPLIG